MLHAWVTSQSETMKTVLDGIAAFFNHNGGEMLMYLVTTIGFLMLIAKYIIEQPNVRQIINWVLVVSILPIVLIKPTTKLMIHDSTSALEQHPVSNIPYGLAYPFSIITSVMHSTTKTLEDSMHVPHDRAYLSTGMVYAAKIFQELNTLQPDPDLMSHWSQFIYMCIDPNVRVRHRFTYKQLFDAPDMMKFLKENTVDGFNRVHIPKEKGKIAANIEEDWPRCLTALTRMEEAFKKSTEWSFKTMGAFDPLNRVKDAIEMQNDIQGVNSYFFKLSGSSQEMIMQNLLINATKSGFQNIAAQKNQMAAALNYAHTQNEMSSMSSWATLAAMAPKYIPMMQTILLMLICCAFIPMVYLAMFPGLTYKILTKYTHSIFWITSWGLFYVFINFIMTAFTKYRVNAYTDVYGGITMSNIDGISYLLSQYQTLTGSFLIFTPYLARLVVLGAAETMGHLITSIHSGVTSNAEAAAKGASTGNYNLYSTNVANHGANNASFNKQNFDREERLGSDSHSTLLGGSETKNPMGDIYRDNRTSHLATQINQNQAITSGLQKSANTHLQNSYSEAQQAQDSWNTTLGNLASVNDTEAMRSARQASHGNTETQSTDQALANMVGLTQRYGKDEIQSTMSGWSFEEGGSISYGAKIPGTKIGFTGHVKGALNQSGTDTTSHTTSMSTEDQQTLKNSVSVLSQSSQSELATAETNLGVDKNHSIQSSFNEAKLHSENANREYRMSTDDQEAATYAGSKGASVTYNDIPQFESWLEQNTTKEAASHYLNDPRMQSSPEFKALVDNYQDEIAAQFKADYQKNKDMIQSPVAQDIEQHTDDKINNNKAEVIETHHANDGTVERQYQEKTLAFEDKVNDLGTDIAGKAVNKTLDEHGFKSNRFKAHNPSTFNCQMVIPPKMYIKLDSEGRALSSAADALRSEIMDSKLSSYQRLKKQEHKAPLGSMEAENDVFLDKFKK